MASRAERNRILNDTKDTAQAMVTCLLNGDRDTPAVMAQEHIAPEVLALVLADLVASVHTAWCGTIMGQEKVKDGWRIFLLDIAKWRNDHDAPED